MIDPDIERAQRLANQATHDSVTAERLTENKIGIKRYRLYDNPLYRYLQSDEKPQFLFHSKRHTPTFNGPSAPKEIERSRQFRVLHLITDSRWLMIAGNRSGDQKHEVLLNEIGATNHQTGDSITSRLSKNLFAIETEGVHYTIPLSNDYNESDLEDLSRFLRNYFDAIRGGVAIDSDEAGYTIAGSDEIKYDAKDVRSRLDRLPDSTIPEADQLISETDDIEELIPRLDSLIEREEESTQSLNDRVDEASSVEELRRDIETPAERTQRRAKERAKNGFEHARKSINQSEPEEVGRWGINIGQAAYPLAIAAPGSTPLWLGAYLALGGAAGVHASGTENSLLADIDPETLANHANALAEKGKGLENIDGEVAGTLLGAFSHLGRQLAPDKYARWIVAADPEAILAGADAGASFAMSDDVSGNQQQGALAGAGLGLFVGYTSKNDNLNALQDVLDRDLYEEYINKTSNKEKLSGQK